jgi:hypothetical protein
MHVTVAATVTSYMKQNPNSNRNCFTLCSLRCGPAAGTTSQCTATAHRTGRSCTWRTWQRPLTWCSTRWAVARLFVYSLGTPWHGQLRRSAFTHQRWVRSQGEIGEVYNIGTQKERTVMDVAHQIAKIFKLPEVLRSHHNHALDGHWSLHETQVLQW